MLFVVENRMHLNVYSVTFTKELESLMLPVKVLIRPDHLEVTSKLRLVSWTQPCDLDDFSYMKRLL